MGRRQLVAVAGLAAGISVATLVIAEATSDGLENPVAAPLLFTVLLASLFTLLAAAIVDADRLVDRLSEANEKAPRWSVRAASRRVASYPVRAARLLLTKIGRAARLLLTKVGQALRPSGAWLRRQLDAEQRRLTMTRAKERWYDALVVLGMPPAAREAGSARASASAEIDPPPAIGALAQLATNGATRLRTAFAAGRRGSETLAARRAPRGERFRPPRSTGPSRATRRRPAGSPTSLVGRLPGRSPFA